MVELDTTQIAGLPPGGDEFLEELRLRIDPKHVRSILFFGSTVTGDISKSSDIDFIIILSNCTSDSYRSKMEQLVTTLANEYLETETAPTNKFEELIQQSTGMFRSGFISKEKNVINGDFHRIFNASPLAYYFAPWRTVMAGVFQETVPVYRDSVSPKWDEIGDPLSHSIEEICRSFVMALSLSILQIIYSVSIKTDGIYAQESYKWTIYNIAYHVRGRPHQSLDEALSTVPDLFGSHDWFKRVRSDPQTNPHYQILVPLIITLLHLWGLCNLVRVEQSATDVA